MTGLRLIVAAYFAILAILFTAGVVVMSVDGLRESRLDALDNKYLAPP